MLNELETRDASQLSDEAETPVEIPRVDYTTEALAAIADLDDESRIDKMMRVGAAIAAAKAALPHGALTKWYKNDLKRSESWCSLYWRLYNDRDFLTDARGWATRTSHKLAGCYGIEQLLKIIADYKAKVLGTRAAAPRTPRAPKAAIAETRSDGIIAQLHKLLADAEVDLEALRLEVATSPSPDGLDAKDALSSLIERLVQQLRDLVESCTAAAGFGPVT
jgi:hypothetical protein